MGVLQRRAADEAAARLAAGVASYALGVPVREILDDGRGSCEAAFARQVAMYLCHTAFELSMTRVAYAFARDRSTVAHACAVIEDRRDDDDFDAWMAALESMLMAPPPPGLRLLNGGAA